MVDRDLAIATACLREMHRISAILAHDAADAQAADASRKHFVADVARLQQEALEARMRAELAEAREQEAIRALRDAEKLLKRMVAAPAAPPP